MYIEFIRYEQVKTVTTIAFHWCMKTTHRVFTSKTIITFPIQLLGDLK